MANIYLIATSKRYRKVKSLTETVATCFSIFLGGYENYDNV
jgi:hypothetical protein